MCYIVAKNFLIFSLDGMIIARLLSTRATAVSNLYTVVEEFNFKNKVF